MKEQLIQFETAKLAKEKGFNWLVTNMFKIGIISKGVIEEDNPYDNVNKLKGSAVWSRPTQTLLQKWLREEHNIHCIVSPVMGGKNGYDSYPLIGWRCDVIGLNKDSTNSYYMGYPILDWFTAESLEEDETLEELNINRDNTYEEALEKGLQEALKLI